MKDERGVVLIATIALIALLAIVSTVTVLTVTTDIKISNNYMTSVKAFYDAEAGAKYALFRVEQDLVLENITLAGTETVNYAASDLDPDFSFDTITELAQIGTGNNFQIQSTGNSTSSTAKIEVLFKRDPVFQYGVFGNTLIDLKSNAEVYSYNSIDTPTDNVNDNEFESTGEADIGSNGDVNLNSVTVNGNVGLGDDDAGTEATYTTNGTQDISGTLYDVDHVDADPLGAVGGSLATTISYAGDDPDHNDNATAEDKDGNRIGLGTVANRIDISNYASAPDDDTIVLLAGDYYIECMILGNGDSLNVDASSGTVVIYVGGDCGNGNSIEAKVGSSINVTGEPTDFIIYSNSSSKIIFRNGTEFRGTIYAPYATVQMLNSGSVYGAILANKVELKNSAVFYYDTALQDTFLTNEISIVSWKDVRN